MPIPFDVALSYHAQDEWLARDIHDLLVASSVKVYCYSQALDATAGNIRDSLREIYATSSLNILIWSEAYATSSADSIVAMERRLIVHRHLNKGDTKTLLIVSADGFPIAEDLEIALVHDLKRTGLLAIEGRVTGRLRQQRVRETPLGPVFHPQGTERNRSALTPCVFTINARFKSDRFERWMKLGDIWVDLPNQHGTRVVYLIPSGLCTLFLRNTTRFLMNPELVEAKKLASQQFVAQVGRRALAGFWFLQRNEKTAEREIVTTYAAEYDRYLNEHFDGALAEVRA